jgi:methylene-fatty-acyl-phospholipid synthase
VSLTLLAVAAVLLSAERVCYVWITRAPDAFRRWCARPAIAHLGEPVAVVRVLFVLFKALQYTVFAGWCWLHGTRSLAPTDDGVALVAGGGLVVVGQVLNVLVFYRLGRIGVFFGDRLGHAVARCRAFPFSRLAHPQYVGTVMTIWGFFLLVRFPYEDWFLLPVLESVYYAIGAALEDADVEAAPVTDRETPGETCERRASVSARSG